MSRQLGSRTNPFVAHLLLDALVNADADLTARALELSRTKARAAEIRAERERVEKALACFDVVAPPSPEP
jgi:hypothetical protein